MSRKTVIFLCIATIINTISILNINRNVNIRTESNYILIKDIYKHINYLYEVMPIKDYEWDVTHENNISEVKDER